MFTNLRCVLSVNISFKLILFSTPQLQRTYDIPTKTKDHLTFNRLCVTDTLKSVIIGNK